MSEGLGERSFSKHSAIAFARLSGDANPLHVDEVASRRLMFGVPVVHGMCLVLWALERLGFRLGGVRRLLSLKVIFRAPVRWGQEVSCWLDSVGEDEAKLSVRSGQATHCTIALSFDTTAELEPRPRRGLPEASASRDLSFEEATSARGELELLLEPAETESLFPGLCEFLPHTQIALLLASTRLVGVVCPGLHSIYSQLTLTRTQHPNDTPSTKATYAVRSANPRYRKLILALATPSLEGTVEAFVRPGTIQQRSTHELQRLVHHREFEGQRALVIGGSRGLGEACAKLLAMGGARVRLTYRSGRDDAAGVADEIGRSGGDCDTARLDVVSGEGVADVIEFAAPTHVYYFATPFIGRSERFDAQLFRRFCEYYVDGFATVVEALAARSTPSAIFYPSTVFLEAPEQGFAEYLAAKAAGEGLCLAYSVGLKNVRVHKSRLPRLATDQTAGLTPSLAHDPSDVMLEELRRFREDRGTKPV